MYRWRFKQSIFHSKTNLREANRWDWIWKSWDKNQTQQGERTEKNSLLLSCWRLSITTQPEKMLKTICYFNHLSDNDSETLLKKSPCPKMLHICFSWLKSQKSCFLTFLSRYWESSDTCSATELFLGQKLVPADGLLCWWHISIFMWNQCYWGWLMLARVSQQKMNVRSCVRLYIRDISVTWKHKKDWERTTHSK